MIVGDGIRRAERSRWNAEAPRRHSVGNKESFRYIRDCESQNRCAATSIPRSCSALGHHESAAPGRKTYPAVIDSTQAVLFVAPGVDGLRSPDEDKSPLGRPNYMSTNCEKDRRR